MTLEEDAMTKEFIDDNLKKLIKRELQRNDLVKIIVILMNGLSKTPILYRLFPIS